MTQNPDRRRFLAALAAGTAGFGLSACYSQGSDRAGKPAAVVRMSDTLKFTPKSVRIRVGDSIEWRNSSLLVHTVTADPDLAALPSSAHLPAGAKPFNSGNLEPGGVFRHRFVKPGTYKYFCIPHEAAGMNGEVVVLP